MRLYHQITLEERRVIQKMRYGGKTCTEIAHDLDRVPSTIYREIARNKTHGYSAQEAHELTQNRKFIKEGLIQKDGLLQMIIVDLLKDKNSPDVIAYYLRTYFKDCAVSCETIYQWLYDKRSSGGARFASLLFTRRRFRQNRKNANKHRGKDLTKKNIKSRPCGANDRSEFGHFEGDLIVGKGAEGYLLTLVERKSDNIWAVPIPSKDEETTGRAFSEAVGDMPKGFVKSITLDNGTEFSAHRMIEEALDCEVYFADPYSSYQRGLNEHMNARLRHYFPKKMRLLDITDEDVQSAVWSINNRPRKSLGWQTPANILDSHLVALRH